MKRIQFLFFRVKTAIYATCLLACFNHADAQNLVLPSTSDLLWFNLNEPPTTTPLQPLSLNTAAIAYNDGITTPHTGLYACVIPRFVHNGPPIIPPCYNEIHVRDYLSGMDVMTVSGSAAYGFDSVIGASDITIGNSDNFAGRDSCNDFILAASYADKAGHPTIDFYDVKRFPGLSITYMSSYKFLPHTRANTVRIDVIAEYGHLYGCGNPLPLCRKFMLTWNEGDSVYVAEGDLFSQSLITAPQFVGQGYEPDVAGVQRKISSAVTDVAYLTFSNGSGEIDFSQWNAGGGPPSTPTPVDISASLLQFPRIDAADDYHLSPLLVQYKIAAMAFNAGVGNYEIRAYDDVNFMPGIAISAHDDYNLPGGCGVSHAGPYHNHQPYVTVYGPNDFAILHTSNSYIAPASNGNFLIAETIDMSTAGNSFWGNNYYKVNGMGCADYDASSGDFRSSASPCPNDLSPNQPIIFAWDNFDPAVGGGMYNIKYKFSLSAAPFFKPGNSTQVTDIHPREWAVYPNPANELLSVKSPEGTFVRSYEITDITGRNVLNGNLTSQSHNIDISTLAKGCYLIKMLNDKNDIKVTSFLKN